MTIERNSLSIVVECDQIGCDEKYDAETGAFDHAWALAKEAGWRAKKEADGQWYHTCPGCNSDF